MTAIYNCDKYYNISESFVLVSKGDYPEILRFRNGDIVVYGDYKEAEKDSLDDYSVVNCLRLTTELKDEIIENIK